MIPKSGLPVFGQDHAQKILFMLFILFTKFKTKPRGISAGLFSLLHTVVMSALWQ
jgi:hypothetical protein